MDQLKIGSFIKELRKEKNMIQDQLAEKSGTSRRTVSRWETGTNMPDLDIIVELTDFVSVDIRELFEGQRKETGMNQHLNKTGARTFAIYNIFTLEILQAIDKIYRSLILFILLYVLLTAVNTITIIFPVGQRGLKECVIPSDPFFLTTGKNTLKRIL